MPLTAFAGSVSSNALLVEDQMRLEQLESARPSLAPSGGAMLAGWVVAEPAKTDGSGLVPDP